MTISINKKYRISKLLFTILFILVPGLLFSQMLADTINIDEIIVLYEKEISQAGITSYNIDSELKSQSSHSNLSDLLKSTGFVYVRDYGSGNLATVSIRGTGASHTQVSWNGLNINSPLTGQVDFSIIPTDFIDLISIYPGNSAIQKQTGSLGGNIILNNYTKTQKGFHFKLGQEIASFNNYNSFLQTQYEYKKLQLISKISLGNSKNSFPFLNTATLPNEESTQDNASSQNFNLSQDVIYNLNKKNTFKFSLWNSSNEREIPALMSYEGTNHLEDQTNSRTLLNLNWTISDEKSKLKIQSGYIYNKMYYILRHYHPEGTITAVESTGISNSFINSLDYENYLSKSLKIEISFNLTNHITEFENHISNISFNKTRNEFTVYSGVYKKFTDRLTSFLMLRNSMYDREISPLSPSLGFEFLLVEKPNLFINGSVGSNYRFPSLNDMYFIPGGNPDLNPERSKSLELGIATEKQILNSKIKVILNSFSTIINDWILWRPTQFAYWQPENIQKVKSQGLESSIDIRGSYREITYRISCNYSLTNTTNESELNSESELNGQQLIYIPTNKGNILSSIKFNNSTLNYNIHYTGLRFINYGDDIQYNTIPSFWIHDINFGQLFFLGDNKFNLTLNIRNIFNVEYQNIRYRATPGINYSIKLSYEL